MCVILKSLSKISKIYQLRGEYYYFCANNGREEKHVIFGSPRGAALALGEIGNCNCDIRSGDLDIHGMDSR